MAGAEGDDAAREAERAASHSGRLLLRMPEELHAELARVSERNGSSLNAFITATLASAVGWRNGAAPGAARRRRTAAPVSSPAPEAPPRRRLLERLLVANLLVVAVVGALAIVLLVRTLS